MSNTELVKIALTLLPQLGPDNTAVSPDNTTRLQRLYQSPLLAADLIAHCRPSRQQQGKTLPELVRIIDEAYNKEELRQLCYGLAIEYEDLEGAGKSGKVLSLVQYAQRHSRLPELLTLCTQQRPRITWPQPDQIAVASFVSKDNLAIVINLASRFDITLSVPQYLDKHTKLDVNFLYFQNPGENRNIPLTADWQEFPKAFAKTVQAAYDLVGAKHAHLFMGGSGPILFSMGCVWSTIRRATCYHFQDDIYHPVLPISKELHG